MKRSILSLILLSAFVLVRTGAAQDTTYAYGGPGTLAGKFETAVGEPDRQGWIGVDLTATDESFWHVDSYNQNTTPCLDPEPEVNHIWWCGDMYPACAPGDPEGGYGDDYNEHLDWWGQVDPGTFDIGSDLDVTLKARLSYDNEPAYDYLYLQYEDDAGGMTQFTTPGVYNGKQTCIDVNEFQSGVTPIDRAGCNGKWVHLRWRFVSDGGWSDEDCDWPTEGAAQIDLIRIYFAQGDTGLVQIGTTETCEPGDPLQWAPPERGVGDFSHVWTLLNDEDPIAQNDTPQFGFIDDGIVVAGTGGTACLSWCYGPYGWCVNYTGGLQGMDHFIWNEVWSPPIALIYGKNFDEVVLEYDIYRHHFGNSGCPQMYDVWHVRSTADPAGETGWSEWRDRGLLYASTAPHYARQKEDVTDLLAPGARHVQIALGVYQGGWVWCWGDNEPTPAPYFDEVTLYTVSNLADVPGVTLSLRLNDPVPNPFNPGTSVSFTLPAEGEVELAVYNLRGQLVRILVDEVRPAGRHTVAWNGTDRTGAAAATGTYLFHLSTGGRTVVKKGILIK